MPTPKTPRPHQIEAADDVVKAFGNAESGQLIMACGTGKTLTAQFIAKGLDAKRILILTPSLSLLSDTLDEWLANAGDLEFLAVCSDDTVVDNSADEWIHSVDDLGFPVTTDPTHIRSFLQRRGSTLVVFSTYQSSPRIAEAFSASDLEGFDLIIADEAHRCAGDVSSAFATVLDREAIPSKRRLFMTATPKIFTGRAKKVAGESDMEIASMDDAVKFGEVVHRLSFPSAIARGLLSDFQVVVIGVDNAEHLKFVESAQAVNFESGRTTDAATLAGQIGLLRAMRQFGLKRVISFHSRVRAAKDFADSLSDALALLDESQQPAGSLWSANVSGLMTASKRRDRLDHLRNLSDDEVGVLSNARCLGEGIDVPALDGVAFIDPRRSEVDVVQAVGRAIRLSPTKTVGTIVIPIVIDSTADPENELEVSAFKPVYDVVKALRSHDETLAVQLDQLRVVMSDGEPIASLPPRIRVVLPPTVDPSFAASFNARLVERTTESWSYWYELLTRFAAREGHALVPTDHIEGSVYLGRWVSGQRRLHKREQLGDDRVNLLEAVPGWSWNVIAPRWDRNFVVLEQFVAREGHARVPKDYVIGSLRLGEWVANQRVKRTPQSSERKAKLEALPGWSWNIVEGRWNEMFERVESFSAREGHALVPRGHREDGFRLGQWASSQRSGKSNGTLSSERIAKLDSLPSWSWRPFDDAWSDGIAHLLSFVEREGHALVPRGHREDGFRLGQWVEVRRKEFHNTGKKRLSPDRIAQLEGLPKWSWGLLEDRWSEGYASLERFVTKHGHSKVPKRECEGERLLGEWVVRIRRAHKRGTLSRERIAKLEAMPGWSWDIAEDQWLDGINELERYVARVGNAVVIASRVEGPFKLVNWVSNRRNEKRLGTLSDDRILQLESFSGWTWGVHEERWNAAYGVLENYVEQFGHARVDNAEVRDGLWLGNWVAHQRALMARGELGSEKSLRLAKLPGWVWSIIDEQWQYGYESLVKFAAKNGHARVPQDFNDEDFSLGVWVNTNRTTKRKGSLSPERASLLEALPGWTWEPVRDRWREGFETLQTFVAREGRALVPVNYTEGSFPLGQWVTRQRATKRRGKLAEDRASLLEALPGWAWEPAQDRWREGFEILQTFVAREGHALVLVNHTEGSFPLGQWVAGQRASKRKRELEGDRPSLLEALPGWAWKPAQDRWGFGIDALTSFVNREGHALVPVNHTEGSFPLGQWVSERRKSHRLGKLEADRVSYLESLPGWVWSRRK
jgi:superfamily II DNA or RNA helicase